MRAGRLRDRVTVQMPIHTRNDFSEEVTTWESGATFAAEVKDLNGKEYFDAKQINADISVQVICRYRFGIKPEYRLKTRSGRVLEIVAPPLDKTGKKREMLLLCKEII